MSSREVRRSADKLEKALYSLDPRTPVNDREQKIGHGLVRQQASRYLLARGGPILVTRSGCNLEGANGGAYVGTVQIAVMRIPCQMRRLCRGNNSHNRAAPGLPTPAAYLITAIVVVCRRLNCLRS